MVSSIFSMAIAFALFFGGVSSLPLDGQVKSGELSFKIEAVQTVPLDPVIAEEIGTSSLNASGEFEIKYKTEEEGKKLELECHAVLKGPQGDPIRLSFWLRGDYTDRNVPKTYLVYKTPDSDKFQYLNIQSPLPFSYYGGNDFSRQMEIFESLSRKLTQKLRGITINYTEKDGQVSASVDEATLKLIAKQAVMVYFQEIMALYSGPYEGMAADYENGIAGINDFFTKLEKVQIFDKNALLISASYDENHNPVNLHYGLNFNTDIGGLMKAFGEDPAEAEKISNLVLSLNADYKFSKLNEDITIEYPLLTAENSTDMMEGETVYGIDTGAVNIISRNELITFSNAPFVKDGTAYVPLRELLKLNGYGDGCILWDNGNIKINTGSMSAELSINNDKISVNGEEAALGAKVLLHGDTTYVPVSALELFSMGFVPNTFYGASGNVIGCVVYLYYAPSRTTISVLSDIDPMWEKYLYIAGEEAGVELEVKKYPPEDFTARTKLWIAAGEPGVILGKFDDEVKSSVDVYKIIPVNGEYSFVVTNGSSGDAGQVIEIFMRLIGQGQ